MSSFERGTGRETTRVPAPIKASAAILKGFEMVGGKQCKGAYYLGDPTKPQAVCVYGARNLAIAGHATGVVHYDEGSLEGFYEAWGVFADELNDGGMPWEHIYGMAVAAGL